MLRMAEEENADDIRDREQEADDSALMGAETDPGTATGDDDNGKALEAIRNGLNLLPDFWDDFLKVVNNSDGLASLLGVDAGQVTQWGEKVSNALKKIKDTDANQPEDERKSVIHTRSSTGETE